MKEQIKKWEAEIETTLEKQKEMNEKYNGRIRGLRKKIEEAEQHILQENNRMIAEAVREIYGEVDQESLEDFKQKIKMLRNGENPVGREAVDRMKV